MKCFEPYDHYGALWFPLTLRDYRLSNWSFSFHSFPEGVFLVSNYTSNSDDINHAKTLRNNVKTSIRRAKATFVQDYLQNDEISVKKFWEKVNYIMPTKCKQPTINLVDQVTQILINSNETSDYINNFVVEIGPKLARNFKEDWIDEVVTDIDNEMDGMTISEEVLMKVIVDINTSKSSAIEHVSARVLKDSFLVLVPQLLHMYQQCLTPSTR